MLHCPWAQVRAGRSLERHRLCSTLDLGATVLPQRVDRPAGQRVVRGEEPGQRFVVVVPAVVQHRQHPGHALDDGTVLNQGGRDALAGAGRGYDGRQLVLADQLADLADADAEQLCDLAPVEPVLDQRGQLCRLGVLGNLGLAQSTTVPRSASTT